MSFSDADLKGANMPHQDAIMITLQVNNFEDKRILVNPGAGTDIIICLALLNMELTTKDVMKTQFFWSDLMDP